MAESDDDNVSEMHGVLVQIERLFDARKYESVIELCAALIERFPTEPMPYYERAQAHNLLGYQRAQARNSLRLQRAALDDINRALERRPKDVRFMFFRGLWSLELGDYSTAVLDLTTIVELEDVSDPSGFCDTARFVRALAYIVLGQFDLALGDLDNLEEMDEDEDDMMIARKIWTRAQLRQLAEKRRRPF
jgi:lipoprotein NlpI